MRKFEIYGVIGDNEDTLSFKNFMKQVEKRINEDSEIIEKAKECNIKFADEIGKIIENTENKLYMGTMISGLYQRIPRYSFIKGIKHNNRIYDAEIDLLERKFYLYEI